MKCGHCEENVNFEYHILKYDTTNVIVGYGSFCSFECASKQSKIECYGESDYFETLSIMLQKYGESKGERTYYSPIKKLDIKPLLQHVEEREAIIPKYKVKRASENKRSTNDVLKNNFFGGKCEPIMTAKNLCFTK